LVDRLLPIPGSALHLSIKRTNAIGQTIQELPVICRAWNHQNFNFELSH